MSARTRKGKGAASSTEWSEFEYDTRGFEVRRRYGPTGEVEYDYRSPDQTTPRSLDPQPPFEAQYTTTAASYEQPTSYTVGGNEDSTTPTFQENLGGYSASSKSSAAAGSYQADYAPLYHTSSAATALSYSVPTSASNVWGLEGPAAVPLAEAPSTPEETSLDSSFSRLTISPQVKSIRRQPNNQDYEVVDPRYRVVERKDQRKLNFPSNYDVTNFSSKLDDRYQLITTPSRFFKKGRVFKALWTEPAGDLTDTADPFVIPSRFGEKAFTKIRHFVVVREMQGCCLCLMLNTYNRQGASKEGVRAENYAAVYPLGGEAQVAAEERLTKAPFPIKVEEVGESIDPTSRINFGRVYMVEHNIKVLKVGRIPDGHLQRLEEYFVKSIVGPQALSKS
jgi:hypothetical protein